MLRSYLYLLVILTAITGLGWWSHRVESLSVTQLRPSSRDLAQAGVVPSAGISWAEMGQIQLSFKQPSIHVGENPPLSERLLEIEEIPAPLAIVPSLKSSDKGQEVFDTKNGRSVD